MIKRLTLAALLTITGCMTPQDMSFRESLDNSKNNCFRLETLLDTEIQQRPIAVFVDQTDINLEIITRSLDRTKKYFETQSINMSYFLVDSLKKSYEKPNEFGVRFFGNIEELAEATYQIKSKIYGDSYNEGPLAFLGNAGIAFPHKNIIFIHENELFNEAIYAFLIAHEIVHCAGIPHSEELFYSEFMSLMNSAPTITPDEKDLGLPIEERVLKLFHSYIAGNSSYDAFNSTGRCMTIFQEMIYRHNPELKEELLILE